MLSDEIYWKLTITFHNEYENDRPSVYLLCSDDLLWQTRGTSIDYLDKQPASQGQREGVYLEDLTSCACLWLLSHLIGMLLTSVICLGTEMSPKKKHNFAHPAFCTFFYFPLFLPISRNVSSWWCIRRSWGVSMTWGIPIRHNWVGAKASRLLSRVLFSWGGFERCVVCKISDDRTGNLRPDIRPDKTG